MRIKETFTPSYDVVGMVSLLNGLFMIVHSKIKAAGNNAALAFF